MITQTQFTTVTNDLTELYNYLQENATEYFDSFTMTEDNACIDCFIDGVKALEIFRTNNTPTTGKDIKEYSSTTTGIYLCITGYTQQGIPAVSYHNSYVIDKIVRTEHGIFLRFGYVSNNSITPITASFQAPSIAYLIIAKTNNDKTGFVMNGYTTATNASTTHAGIKTFVPQSQTHSFLQFADNLSFHVDHYSNSWSNSGTMTILVPIPCKRLNDLYPQEYFPHVFFTPMYQFSSYFVPVEIEGKKYIGNSAILLEDE